MRLSVLPERCPGVNGCGHCLEACREGVLMAHPSGFDRNGKPAYRVVTVLRHRCDRCGRCRDACPFGAIRLD